MKFAIKVFIAWAFLSLTAVAGIFETPHDFVYGMAAPEDYDQMEVCNICHPPSTPTYTESQTLWDKTNEFQQGFMLYQSPDAYVAPGDVVFSQSTATCLGCHDGVFGSAVHGPEKEGPSLGIDLRNDHPVGIQWDMSKEHLLAGPTNPEIKLQRNQVECASCHNPHNNLLGKFQIIPNKGSALCKTCHSY